MLVMTASSPRMLESRRLWTCEMTAPFMRMLYSTSLATSKASIADYHATAGNVRGVASDLNHAQPGDPDRLAKVLVDFADAPNPPVRLPLGSDTVAAIEAKHASDAAILKGWHSVAVSTDFAAG